MSVVAGALFFTPDGVRDELTSRENENSEQYNTSCNCVIHKMCPVFLVLVEILGATIKFSITNSEPVWKRSVFLAERQGSHTPDQSASVDSRFIWELSTRFQTRGGSGVVVQPLVRSCCVIKAVMMEGIVSPLLDSIPIVAAVIPAVVDAGVPALM